jgi:hypothetical protein
MVIGLEYVIISRNPQRVSLVVEDGTSGIGTCRSSCLSYIAASVPLEFLGSFLRKVEAPNASLPTFVNGFLTIIKAPR